MLADNLPRGMVTPNEHEQIDRLAQYIALIHVPYFLQALLSSAAPRLDLALWQDVTEYENIDEEIANAVKSSIKRQPWYLTQVHNTRSRFYKDFLNATSCLMCTIIIIKFGNDLNIRNINFDMNDMPFHQSRIFIGNQVENTMCYAEL